MSARALHPLPEPGTIAALALDLLEGAAIEVFWREANWSHCHTVAAAGFLRWLDLCRLTDWLFQLRPSGTP